MSVTDKKQIIVQICREDQKILNFAPPYEKHLFAFWRRFRGVAQLASVLAWGARGRQFESVHPDFFRIKHLQLIL